MTNKVEKVDKEVSIAQNPNNFIQLAITNNAPIESLERLMDLQERWEKNEARKAYFDAKANFQKRKPIIKKTQSVSFGSDSKARYKFAPLSEIEKAVDPILADLGLSYDFKQLQENNQIKITCVLSHKLGHSEETSLSAPADTSGNKNAIQSIGSTVSYLKRYTLANILGLSSGEDDDGHSGITNKEANIIKLKVELVELYILKKSNLNEDGKNRLEEIILNDEVNSYKKAIKNLKTY